MTKRHEIPPIGGAGGGVFVAEPALFLDHLAAPRQVPAVAAEGFRLESDDSLRTREEQRFFDWSIGVLEDAGVVGVLKNDYVYQATSLHGEIHGSAGGPYFVTLSRTSVEFDDEQKGDCPIQFTGAAVETDGEDLEAHQVGRVFDLVRLQSALARAWKDCTSMGTNHSVIFRDLRILFSKAEIALDVEAELCKFTVSVHQTSEPSIFRYSLIDADSPLAHSRRVADALLSDVAEEAGGDPQPSTIVGAMISAAGLARTDPEWLAADLRGRARRN